MSTLPSEMEWLFWEVDFATVDAQRDADFVLARVLEFGRMVDVRWAVREYGMERIHDFFRSAGHPELSGRTLSFWRAVFDAEDEKWVSSAAQRKSRLGHWTS